MKIYYYKDEENFLFTDAKNIFDVQENEIAAVFNFNVLSWFYFADFGTGKTDSITTSYRKQFKRIALSNFPEIADVNEIYKKLKSNFKEAKEDSVDSPKVIKSLEKICKFFEIELLKDDKSMEIIVECHEFRPGYNGFNSINTIEIKSKMFTKDMQPIMHDGCQLGQVSSNFSWAKQDNSYERYGDKLDELFPKANGNFVFTFKLIKLEDKYLPEHIAILNKYEELFIEFANFAKSYVSHQEVPKAFKKFLENKIKKLESE